MKTKKLMLGSLVFVFAIGTAFASLMAPQPIHVKALLTNGNEECVQLDEQCEDTGAEFCTVRVPVQSGPDVTSQTYEDSNCTIPLRNTTDQIIEAEPVDPSKEIFELVESN